MKRGIAAALALLLVLGALWAWRARQAGPAKEAAPSSPLFTGKEPKLKVRLAFPSKDKPGFSFENFEIYQTASRSSQLKQALMQLFMGPQGPAAAAAFPIGFKLREVFLTERGLAVVDLDPEAVKSHPGGTSSEFVSLYCMVKTLTENFREVRRVQFLVGGEARESLAGHLDISTPLSLEDF